MKRNSRSSSAGDIAIVVAAGLLLGGCSEAMQKKFIRQKAEVRPSPIINFEDYSAGSTPADRYRKHYMVFDYWNAELMDALTPSANNPKRLRHASQESLNQLQSMVAMLASSDITQAQRLIEERQRIDRQLQDRADDASQLALLRQRVELNQRQIHRLISVGKVQDRLKPGPEKLTNPQQASDKPQ